MESTIGLFVAVVGGFALLGIISLIMNRAYKWASK